MLAGDCRSLDSNERERERVLDFDTPGVDITSLYLSSPLLLDGDISCCYLYCYKYHILFSHITANGILISGLLIFKPHIVHSRKPTLQNNIFIFFTPLCLFQAKYGRNKLMLCNENLLNNVILQQ